MELSEKTVSECTDMVDKATQSLLDILSSVEVSVEQIQTITAASEEQSTNSTEIAKHTEEINVLSNQSASVTQDILKSTSQVNSLTDELNMVIANLKSSVS
jgi:methyl-accepting chemotaxis protein